MRTTTRNQLTKRHLQAAPSRRIQWWLWPHLLSLDAPLVAVAWQSWWARSAGVALPWQHGAILGAAVWTIYVADRLADVSRSGHANLGTARHVFYHNTPLPVLAWLVGGLLLALGTATPLWLPATEFRAGLILLAVAVAYFWFTHRVHTPSWTRILPKEGVVGGLFAVGTAIFVRCRVVHPSATLWLAWLACVALFFLNCALITCWESTPQDRRDPASLQNAFPVVARWLGSSCLALGALAAGASWLADAAVFLPVAASACFLWLLDRCHTRMAPDALRILADVALLTPYCWSLADLR